MLPVLLEPPDEEFGLLLELELLLDEPGPPLELLPVPPLLLLPVGHPPVQFSRYVVIGANLCRWFSLNGILRY